MLIPAHGQGLAASACLASCSFFSGQAAEASLQNVIISFGLNHEVFKNKGKHNLLSSPSTSTITLNKRVSNLLSRTEYGAQM